jgi:hypothetical protein
VFGQSSLPSGKTRGTRAECDRLIFRVRIYGCKSRFMQGVEPPLRRAPSALAKAELSDAAVRKSPVSTLFCLSIGDAGQCLMCCASILCQGKEMIPFQGTCKMAARCPADRTQCLLIAPKAQLLPSIRRNDIGIEMSRYRISASPSLCARETFHRGQPIFEIIRGV